MDVPRFSFVILTRCGEVKHGNPDIRRTTSPCTHSSTTPRETAQHICDTLTRRRNVKRRSYGAILVVFCSHHPWSFTSNNDMLRRHAGIWVRRRTKSYASCSNRNLLPRWSGQVTFVYGVHLEFRRDEILRTLLYVDPRDQSADPSLEYVSSNSMHLHYSAHAMCKPWIHCTSRAPGCGMRRELNIPRGKSRRLTRIDLQGQHH